MNNSFTATAKTNSGNITYKADICIITPESINNLISVDYFKELCKNGCANYAKKWSCPPYAPLYKDYAAGWNKLAVFLFQTDISQFFYIKNKYLKIKAANSILKSRADKYLRALAIQHGAYISTGSCRLCKPCKCKLDLPCAYPQKMAYSFEAMGVNVGALVQTCFGSELLWYNHGNLPKHTSVVCGLLTNNDICIDELTRSYDSIISFIR